MAFPKRHWVRNTQMEAFLHDKVEEHREKVQAALDRYNRGNPRYQGTIVDFKVFTNHRMFSTAGKAYTLQRMIEINLDLFKGDLNPETNKDLADTLIHELCHLMCPKEHHGWYWQNAMLAFGLEATRCHSMEVEKKRSWDRYDWNCPSCNFTYKLTKTLIRRRSKSPQVRCGRCHVWVSTETMPKV